MKNRIGWILVLGLAATAQAVECPFLGTLSAPLPLADRVRLELPDASGRDYRLPGDRAEDFRPILVAVEAGLARWEANGWSLPGQAQRPFRIEVSPTESALDRGPRGAWLRVWDQDRGAEGMTFDILHGLAHSILSRHSLREDAWWEESTALYLAEWGMSAVPGTPGPFAQGLSGPAISPDVAFVSGLVGLIGDDGLLEIWHSAEGSTGGSLRAVVERRTGRPFEEVVVELALLRDEVSDDATGSVSAEERALDVSLPAIAGLSWSTRRLAVVGSGGIELRLAGGQAQVYAVARYRDPAASIDIVPLAEVGVVRLPLAALDRLSLIAFARDLSASAPVGATIAVRGLPDFPFRLSEPATFDVSAGVGVLSWATEAQSDLLGWRIERFELGQDAATPIGETLLPASDEEDGRFSYRFVDTEVTPDRRFAYRVEAVTAAGVLAPAFEVH